MLEELNQDQEQLIDKISNEWISDAHSGNIHIDQIKAASSLKSIYALAELKEPEIIFFSGPIWALEFCREDLKQKVETIDFFGLGYDSGWVSFYDYFQRIGIIERDDHEFNTFNQFLRSGVWATILFENIAICISRPKKVAVDEHGNLHCNNGPAIAFADGYEEFAWHGAWVSEKIIMNPEKITRDDIINEKNSEVSRAMAERLGWEEYMKRAETVLIDKWFDTKTSCHYELWDFKKRFELTPKLLKMESPEVLNGTRPYYIEPVHPGLKTCEQARKWQFSLPSGEWPSVEDCIKNPHLEFVEER